MKKILLFLFLALLTTPSFAQYAHMKVGGSVGYSHIFTKWNEAIEEYNVSTPGVPFSVASLSDGWNYGVNLDYFFSLGRVKDPARGGNSMRESSRGFLLGVSYHTDRYREENRFGDFYSDMNARFHSLGMYMDFYFLQLTDHLFIERIKENAFFRVSGQYTWMQFDFEGNLPDVPPLTQEGLPVPSTLPLSTRDNSLGIGVGLGYHIYITDRIAVTPTVQGHFSFGHEIPGLREALGSTSFNEQSTVFRPSVGITVSYAIKQAMPLCPIETCHVQQEHSHRILKGIPVRGNSYSLRQNQRYGDIHRGQIKEPKQKEFKSQKAVRKKVKDSKKKRRRLRIVD
ncbi:autotransporter outer membrane beta-barrel domain-containing protein [Algivirga pacifica]|uniref:Outer membrane protein beta-barrel domain-containing protein n=1 Tax=Algivirga pacifica TaxID=1162670 RepID=A0ABP9DNG0_9BACT